MKTKIFLAILVVVAVAGTLGGIKFLQIRKLVESGKSFTMPPETVSSVVAHEEKWQDTLSAISSITAEQGVNVSAEIAGVMREIAFESGAAVTNGALLVRLDTSSEEAQLRALDAQVELAKVNLERTKQLRSGNTVSQSELDTAEATLKQNQGNADAIRATIAKKTIRAPFGGRLGIRLVNLGEYLDTGKPIVSLQSLQPMHADFSLPQQSLAQVKTGMRVRLVTDTFKNAHFEGSLTAITPEIDVTTRSVRLRATFENAEGLLRPGMFAKVEVLLPNQRNVLVVPATSILSAPFGDSVYVIEKREAGTNGPAGLFLRQQFIRTGGGRGDFISVESGLKPGEKIVSAGLFKLRNGISVVENNEFTPKSTHAPKPADS